MADSRLKKYHFNLLLLTLFLSTLLISIFLLHQAAENANFFSQWYPLLFILNGICLVALIGLIGSSLLQLLRQIRQQEMGSHLTTKLVTVLIFLAILPAGFMYIFSLSFLQKGVDSWFDNKIEATLSEAMKISRTALNERMNFFEAKLLNLAQLSKADPEKSIKESFLSEYEYARAGFELLQLYNADGQPLFFNEQNTNRQLDPLIRDHLKNERSYVVLEPRTDNSIIIRTAVRVTHPTSNEKYYIYGISPITDDMGVLAQRVHDAFSHYQSLIYIREPLKNSFVLTLTLALLQSLLTAIWAAFYFAQKIVAPIRILAKGTRAVAVGNYQQQLPEISHDELGLLVKSFNDMTRRIDLAQTEAQNNQVRAETQRLYFETVLQNLSSGVITFDDQDYLRTANTAASTILRCDIKPYFNQHIDVITQQQTPLSDLLLRLKSNMSQQQLNWSEETELVLADQMRTLMCRGTQLPQGERLQGGYVLVFDDVTQLIRAQKESAWSDVARRLAHEIKNPLTPIQLSAERLQHKYQNKLQGEDVEVLNKATSTIINQVESMKVMVRAFSEYAKSPKSELKALNLNQLIFEVTELYQNHANSTLKLSLGKQEMRMMGDQDRLRQLLHNLIKNAIEANVKHGGNHVYITTRLHSIRKQPRIELCIEDEGPGIESEIMGRLFEPYVTSKTKGTGLGLAIAKKIVEEHSGTVKAQNLSKGGARFVVHFPLLQPNINASTGTETR